MRRWPFLLSLALAVPGLVALLVMLLPVTAQHDVAAGAWRPSGAAGLVLELGPLFPDGLPRAFPDGDSMDAPSASTLRVTVNGLPAGPAHAQHADIAESGQGAFSHWRDALYFSPPAGLGSRDRVATVTLSWPVLPPTPMLLGLAWGALGLGLGLALWETLRWLWSRRPLRPPAGRIAAPRPEYRPDIDGLRAVALLLILDVHLGVRSLPGAFLGVDIFFVISGYLISDILLRQFGTGYADFAGFFRRRVFRLLPASLVVGFVTMVLGYALLLPRDYAQFGDSLLAAILGFANLHFLQHTGYFDAPAQTMPMLHHWSLSVEMQFYLVWPFVLAMALRLPGRRSLGPFLVIGAVFLLSFAAAVHGARTMPAAAFFLPQNRAWEFAAGAMACLVPRRESRFAQVVPVLGVVMLAIGVLTMNSANPHPDWPALVPVLGTALIVHGGGPRALVGRVLAWRPLVAVGLASYSIYLWHWPLIALWHHYTSRVTLTATESLALLAASLVLGFTTWRWVEVPWRRGVPAFRGARLSGISLAALVAAGVAAIIHTDGFPGRLSEAARRLADQDAAWAWTCPHMERIGLPHLDDPALPSLSCVAGLPWGEAQRRAILWGDSTAEHLMPLLHPLALQESMSIALVAGCPAIIAPDRAARRFAEMPDYTERCGAMQDSLLSRLRERPGEVDTVLIVGAWETLSRLLLPVATTPADGRDPGSLLRAGFQGLLPQLAGVPRVVVMDPPPTQPITNPADCLLQGLGVWRAGCGPALAEQVRSILVRTTATSRAITRQLPQAWPNMRHYDPADFQCDERACLVVLDGWPLYRDTVHWRRDLPEGIVLELVERLRLRSIFTPAGDRL